MASFFLFLVNQSLAKKMSIGGGKKKKKKREKVVFCVGRSLLIKRFGI